jgi:hypothetical protein
VKVLGGPIRHEDELECYDEVFARLLSNVFDAVPGSITKTVRNAAHRAGFNVRLTDYLVDWVGERAQGRADKEGSPTPAKRICAPAECRDFYRARNTKLLRAKPVSNKPSQVIESPRL